MYQTNIVAETSGKAAGSLQRSDAGSEAMGRARKKSEISLESQPRCTVRFEIVKVAAPTGAPPAPEADPTAWSVGKYEQN